MASNSRENADLYKPVLIRNNNTINPNTINNTINPNNTISGLL